VTDVELVVQLSSLITYRPIAFDICIFHKFHVVLKAVTVRILRETHREIRGPGKIFNSGPLFRGSN
jgi:hypothetical protein